MTVEVENAKVFNLFQIVDGIAERFGVTLCYSIEVDPIGDEFIDPFVAQLVE